MKLIFATNNNHKLYEVQAMLGNSFDLIGLKELNFSEDIPENHDTLEENAFEKAFYIYSKFAKNCFADDTGLEVEALNGKPGVKSARYAGDSRNPNANMEKVLSELNYCNNRNAKFRTVIALIIDGEKFLFEGIVEGVLLNEKRGSEGFGYDPIFLPNGYTQTFAEMPLSIKNTISHRARAFTKLVEFLSNSQLH
jgi:XTP/dITP diphosphohydrolase